MNKKIEYIGILRSYGSGGVHQLFFKMTGNYSINIFIEKGLAVSKARVRPNTYKFGWHKLRGERTFILPEPIKCLVNEIAKSNGFFVSSKVTTNEIIIFSAYFAKLMGKKIPKDV